MERRGLPIFCTHNARIRSFQDAGVFAGHGRREIGALRHVERTLTTRNEAWGRDPKLDPLDLVGQIKSAAARQGAVFRQGASVGIELLVWATAEAWAAGGQRLKDVFLVRVRALAGQLYGEESVAAVRVDHDEPSGQIHGSAFIVPVFETTTKTGKKKRVVSTKRALDGYTIEALRRHGQKSQDAVFEAFRDFGPVRGIPSNRKQIPPAILRRIGEIETDLACRDAAVEVKIQEAKDARRNLDDELDRTCRLARQFEHEILNLTDALRRARAEEAEVDAAKKRAARAEAQAQVKAEELRIREDRLRDAEQARVAAEKEIEEGLAAWSEGQAEPLSARGKWEIRQGTPDARVRALRGAFGNRIWDQVVECMKVIAVKADERFAKLDLPRLLYIYGNAPSLKRARMLGDFETVAPSHTETTQPMPALEKRPTSARPATW